MKNFTGLGVNWLQIEREASCLVFNVVMDD